MTQNNKINILIVDNLSPYTRDIVKCVSSLGVRYTTIMCLSLANAVFRNEETNIGLEALDPGIRDSGGYSHLLNSAAGDRPTQRLGIYLNGNNGGSSSVGHAENAHNNGKILVDKVILSGRRANDQKINAINSQLIKHCLKADVPLLGICYGAEILALTLGGSIKKMPKPVHDNIAIAVSKSNPLILTEGRHIFYESHSYCVSRLPEGFESLASSNYCEHEIFSFHRLFGTQFHPEKSGIDGYNLLSNFIAM